jgi:hypothetical protein
MLATVFALYNEVGLTSPTPLGKEGRRTVVEEDVGAGSRCLGGVCLWRRS